MHKKYLKLKGDSSGAPLYIQQFPITHQALLSNQMIYRCSAQVSCVWMYIRAIGRSYRVHYGAHFGVKPPQLGRCHEFYLQTNFHTHWIILTLTTIGSKIIVFTISKYFFIFIFSPFNSMVNFILNYLKPFGMDDIQRTPPKKKKTIIII